VVVLEPFTHQQAKDIIPYAFDLSEQYGLLVIVRETTRLAQSRAPFTLGEVPQPARKAVFNHTVPLHNLPRPHIRHAELHARLEKIRTQEFEKSPWNQYTGPRTPSLLIITSGTGWKYANEAVQILSAKDVGILALATLSPLPEKLILKHLRSTQKVLFLEEIDPYLETQVRSLAAGLSKDSTPRFYGKLSGHTPSFGECNIDHALDAISKIQGIKHKPVSRAYATKAKAAAKLAPSRALTFCPGCPHRAAYYSLHQAIKRNMGKGFVTGDIGCYSLGAFYHDIMRSQLSMGAGVGLASGFGKLDQFGLDEPVIAVMGDSTFYHACLPALVNIIYTQSKVTSIIFDNQSTAMTGFQPHPGIGIDATGGKVTTVPIENLLKGIGFTDIAVLDPFDIKTSTDAIYKAINAPTSHAIVFRRECALITNRRYIKTEASPPRFVVDSDKCIGESCKICSVKFNCPACVWDTNTLTARIDEVLCNGCGVCVQICPAKAIKEVKG
jgi:indolepyruvate ferredoxin oxidoreductase alpha subunit